MTVYESNLCSGYQKSSERCATVVGQPNERQWNGLAQVQCLLL